MFVSNSLRKAIRKLPLIGLVATVMISLGQAAVPGFPFTEDFTDNSLEDAALTTADWDITLPGTLRLGFATELTAMTLTRIPMGGAGEDLQTSRDMVLGDLDGDGDLDAVAGNEGTDTGGGPAGAANLIYFNNAGSFDQAPVPVAADSTRTRGLAIGDLDRDGDLDIVAGNFQRSAVYYLNDGTGVFSPGTALSGTTGNTSDVALADIDGDGDLDFIQSNSNGRNFVHTNRLMEDGVLSFGTESNITNASFATFSIAVGDINNDGDVDLITGDRLTGNHIYSNNGSGVFTARGEVHINLNETFSVALADLNGDGLLDLVEGNSNLPTQIYFNVGAGNFSAPVSLSDSNPGHTAVALLLRDFDRDGDIDIVEGNNGAWDHDNDAGTPRIQQPIRLFLNNGTGTFAAGIDNNPPEIQKPYGMAAGDIDGDGQVDIVTGNSTNNVGGPPALAGNAVYFNDAISTANSVRQLDGTAVSLEVDGGPTAIPSARLTVDLVQPAALADLDFFLSNDNGVNFLPVEPGRPVAFPNPSGSALLWKVEMLTSSPHATQLAEINQINIAANNAPAFTNLGDLNGTEGQPLNPTFLSNYFSDADNDVLTYQVSGLPNGTGLSLDAKTGRLSGTLTNADAQASPITMAASAFDGAEFGNGNLRLNVNAAVNDPPTAMDDGPFVTDEGGTVSGNVLVNDTDPENDPLTAILGTGPGNAASFVLNSDGTFDYTHDGGPITSDSFTYKADDGNSQSAEATVRITINPIDDPPVITLNGSATINLNVGDTYNDAGATAQDEEDGDISTSIVVGGDTVNTGAAGTYVITYDVTDSGGNAAVQVTRTVIVSAPPPPPPPPPRRGGGFFGPIDLIGLALIVLASHRRRKWLADRA